MTGLLTGLFIITTLHAADWYEFTGKGSEAEGSVIGMESWLPPITGKERVEIQDDKLLLGGAPIKLWGVNTNYSANKPPKQVAEDRVAFYRKYGINLVRLHKLTGASWAGFGDVASALKFDPEGLDNFDYFTSELRDNGIRYAFSAVFKLRVGPEDKERIPWFDEHFEIKPRGGVRGEGYGLVFASPELQGLLIEQMVNLLNHRNPYSGMTYAEDPALVYLETINEENLYWYSSMGAIQKVPTLKKQFAAQFSEWLEDKYGSHQDLVDAWGKGALNAFGKTGFPNEHLDKKNIYPVGNPWHFHPDQLKDVKSQRLIDTMVFFAEVQIDFFERYQQAMRDAGFQGFFVGTNWQAGSGPAHFLNLYSEASAGMVDKHNYFGGGLKGETGPFNNKSMLSQPGGGFFSAGLQQVASRPFMLSEWIHVTPNEYAGEGPVIVAAYGLGLQGWDAATVFTQRRGGTNSIAPTMFESRWDFGKPNIITLYPTLSRMIYRGDIKEGPVIGALRVSMEEMEKGELGFQADATQKGDVKSFRSSIVPPEALAAGRCVVEFTDNPEPSLAVDMSVYRKHGGIMSTTNELLWIPGESEQDGYALISSEGTVAAIGFLPAKPIHLGAAVVTPEKEGFAIITATALEADRTLSTSDNILVTAVARARQTGMEISADGNTLIRRGKPPILMEPVRATLQFRQNLSSAEVLDHDGVPTGIRAEISGRNTLEINTGEDKSMYYLIRK